MTSFSRAFRLCVLASLFFCCSAAEAAPEPRAFLKTDFASIVQVNVPPFLKTTPRQAPLLPGGGDTRLLTFIRRCQRWLAPIHDADIILVLIGFWLLAQLSPETLLFGAGNLRGLLDIPSPVDYDPSAFFAIETAIIACNMTTISLIVRFLLAPF